MAEKMIQADSWFLSDGMNIQTRTAVKEGANLSSTLVIHHMITSKHMCVYF